MKAMRRRKKMSIEILLEIIKQFFSEESRIQALVSTAVAVLMPVICIVFNRNKTQLILLSLLGILAATAISAKPVAEIKQRITYANTLQKGNVIVPENIKEDDLSKFSNECIKLGIDLVKSAKYSLALRAYDMAIQVNAENAEAYFHKGNVLDDMKEYGKALEAYDIAIKYKEKYPDALINKGITLGRLSRYTEANQTLDKAIELAPKDAQAYYNKALASCGLGKYEDALTACDKAISINPDYDNAKRRRKDILEKLHRNN
jgi:tetratricopeptide (TPR) repeat protein